MENITRVGLGMYVLNEKNQILLGYRIGKHAFNTWSAPGGHLDFMEEFADGAIREAKEEVDLDIKKEDVRIIGVTNDKHQDENKHYTTIHMVANKYEGEVKLMEPNKYAEWKWFDLDDLPKQLLESNRIFFSDKENIKRILNKNYKI